MGTILPLRKDPIIGTLDALSVVLADVGGQGSGPLSGREAARATGTRDRVKVVHLSWCYLPGWTFCGWCGSDSAVTDERNEGGELKVRRGWSFIDGPRFAAPDSIQ